MFHHNAIVKDKTHHPLISDEWNNYVYITDCDGHFIRYIECPSTGGISIDTDHNLVTGELTTGRIHVIKYSE